MRRFLMAITMAVAALVACQTITEELPTRPNPVVNPIPVVVVPIPLPSPTNPTPAPAPAPAPQPNPAPVPPPDEGGNFPSNNNPVVRLGAKVFFLECGGAVVPGSEHATEVQVGCRIHFDCTPKDANNQHTRARGTPVWSFNDMSLIRVGSTVGYTPTATARTPGLLVAWAQVDGVRSNDVSVRIY